VAVVIGQFLNTLTVGNFYILEFTLCFLTVPQFVKSLQTHPVIEQLLIVQNVSYHKVIIQLSQKILILIIKLPVMNQRVKGSPFGFNNLAFHHKAKNMILVFQLIVADRIVVAEVHFCQKFRARRVADAFLSKDLLPAEAGHIKQTGVIKFLYVMFQTSAHAPTSFFTLTFRNDSTADELRVLKGRFRIQIGKFTFCVELSSDPAKIQVIFKAFVEILLVQKVHPVIQVRQVFPLVQETEDKPVLGTVVKFIRKVKVAGKFNIVNAVQDMEL